MLDVILPVRMPNKPPHSMTSNPLVLLVDDEDSTHFLHSRIITRTAPGTKVVSVRNGVEALAYLRDAAAGNAAVPTHIWLDLQMPRMDGWTFMEQYLQEDIEFETPPYITIVTSSPNPDEFARALGFPGVGAYCEKFMTETECLRLLNTSGGSLDAA